MPDKHSIKLIREVHHNVSLLLLVFCTSLAALPALAQDDLLEKIKRLEQQIRELKTLKNLQNVKVDKSEQCMKIVALEKFCTCIGNSLPRAVGFERYVHTLVTSKDALSYSGMSQDQKKEIDDTINVCDICIEKEFFK